MIKLSKEEINRRGSNTWLLCNDNSRSIIHRNEFIKQHGGIFKREGAHWKWSIGYSFVVIKDPEKEKVEVPKKWIFADDKGNQYHIDNLTEFCKQFSLSRQKIYDLMNGTRKSHKGFKFVSKMETDPA